MRLACPRCKTDLDGEACAPCGEVYPLVDGIHRFLPTERRDFYRDFLRDYTAVRLAEGRGTSDAAYLQRLPEPTPTDPLAWQWAHRNRTWATVRRHVLPTLGNDLVVVDVGAGVGWMSNRLDELGHRPHAVDLTVDDEDGLGAARHYQPRWARYQAEMDGLPFAGGTADVVIYNASLHYSTDYHRTIAEALRVLRDDGTIVVMDSPIYHQESSGRQMVAERHADFEQRFGTRSDSVASIEYLTDARLERLAADLDIRWTRHRTWYGWQWAARPWKARLRRRREPSRFIVLVGRRAT